MAKPKLISVRVLKNHGARIIYKSTRTGLERVFVRPDGVLSTFEAAKLLKTYPLMILRMVAVKRLAGRRDCYGRTTVSLAECRRLLRLPALGRLQASPPR